jgi:hypothetical protein
MDLALNLQWSRVFLEELTVTQLVNEFPTIYGTRLHIALFTKARVIHINEIHN